MFYKKGADTVTVCGNKCYYGSSLLQEKYITIITDKSPQLTTRLKDLNTCFVDSVKFLTWLEEHNGFEAGKLCGINSEGLEAAEDLLQEA